MYTVLRSPEQAPLGDARPRLAWRAMLLRASLMIVYTLTWAWAWAGQGRAGQGMAWHGMGINWIDGHRERRRCTMGSMQSVTLEVR